jgi:hypothetical protein
MLHLLLELVLLEFDQYLVIYTFQLLCFKVFNKQMKLHEIISVDADAVDK